MTGALSPTHWLVILVVVLLLFGAKRMPDAARGIGRSLRIFKAETKALTDDGESPAPAPAPAAVEAGPARPAGMTPAADPAPARSTDASTV
ncbi:Sec-independent protein translocase subunit TatA [Actinomycetospora callitridis]|uniref:Sec-independent protein translocase subunit TatA n=1 Tax=Actinomycetospora callitridis TaxID=913944 RepID=UPI00236709EE|nr:Sec-independent protein translocase subunit TatA [Actinomycetospora callitridis]MDD7916353.1 Sec-independent protein translocase subunit TatA [Actinomycetospora callitridis]